MLSDTGPTENHSILKTNVSNNLTSQDVFDVDTFLRNNMGERHLPTSIVILLTVVYVVIFLTGMLGNVSTCIVVMRNSYMHTATNYYLFSLAISDVVSLLLGKYNCTSFFSDFGCPFHINLF